ncbi:hypothetical protein P7C71_g6352, partial [Lecanoromycetidae sp. Uapishka_2]
MPAISSPNRSIEEDDESDWEYEYHQTETEKRVEQSTPEANGSASPAAGNGNLDGADDALDISQQDPMSLDQSRPSDLAINGENDIKVSEGRLQILDFHTSNPIISYQNQIYSCEWTSALGTDVLLSAPDPDFQDLVLREFPDVSVVSATRIKLFARPIQLTSRSETNKDLDVQAERPASESASQLSSTPPPDKSAKVIIPVGKTPTLARQNQARFLERLMAIKAAKGETDEVTVYAQKTNQGSGWRSQHKALHEQGKSDDDVQSTTPARSRGGRQRGRSGRTKKGAWRTLGPRTQKGGLFRDYRPRLWDTEGADIRAGPSVTPESWDQLEDARDGGYLPNTGEKQSPVANAGHRPQQPRGDDGVVSSADRAVSSTLASGFQPQRVGTASELSMKPDVNDTNNLSYQAQHPPADEMRVSFADNAGSETILALQSRRIGTASGLSSALDATKNTTLDQGSPTPVAAGSVTNMPSHDAATESDVEMQDV